jgi:hypothetical protein
MRFQCDILDGPPESRDKLTVTGAVYTRSLMAGRMALLALLTLAPTLPLSTPARAQDVPGIEICTVEKSMERRTSCLQSNVDFLQKTIGKLAAEYQQKLDSAGRQIGSLKATVAGLQRAVDELQAARNKALEDQKKKIEVPAAGNGPPAKERGK